MKIADLKRLIANEKDNATILVAVSEEHPGSRTPPDIYKISYLERGDEETIFIRVFEEREL